LVTEADFDLAPAALEVFQYFTRCNGNDPLRFEKALNGLAELSFDFIRLQGRFRKTGHYRATDTKIFELELYSKPERMREYLDGLLMSYALWPNHVRIYEFMKNEFAPRFPRDAEVIEIGVGHGLMAATAMQSAPSGHYFGFDLSQSSLNYCASMLEANGVDKDRMSMRHVDATHPEAFAGLNPASSRRRVLCCEVLEHVEAPEKILNAIRTFIGMEGEAFITTVANIEAEDHIYLYHDADHIRAQLIRCGLTPVQERALVVPSLTDEKFVPLNYAVIARATN